MWRVVIPVVGRMEKGRRGRGEAVRRYTAWGHSISCLCGSRGSSGSHQRWYRRCETTTKRGRRRTGCYKGVMHRTFVLGNKWPENIDGTRKLNGISVFVCDQHAMRSFFGTTLCGQSAAVVVIWSRLWDKGTGLCTQRVLLGRWKSAVKAWARAHLWSEGRRFDRFHFFFDNQLLENYELLWILLPYTNGRVEGGQDVHSHHTYSRYQGFVHPNCDYSGSFVPHMEHTSTSHETFW